MGGNNNVPLTVTLTYLRKYIF